MESCFLPIELCENVMDVLQVYIKLPEDGLLLDPQYAMDSQRALCSCALTCHAWRVRAQYLLWTFPTLSASQPFVHFKTAIRKSPNITLIRGLLLGNRGDYDKNPDLSTAGELFMQSFPHLQSLQFLKLAFNRGPPLRELRMRLPFFDSITTLALVDCTFQSLQGMLEVVWACSNLATLVVRGSEVEAERCSPAVFQRLYTAVENLRACRKLTILSLDMDTMKCLWVPANINIGYSGVGRIFGCAITKLHINSSFDPEIYTNFFRDSFPALRSVTVSCSMSFGHWGPPWLHSIATGRPIPGILKTIVLECDHVWLDQNCCDNAVGTSEEVAGSAQRLPELLPELAELVLRLDTCNYPQNHAAYIWTVLRGFRGVLRFEYRAERGNAWKPYTVIPQNVPQLLHQDTNPASGSHLDNDWEDILPTP